jgi:hypothetical protein
MMIKYLSVFLAYLISLIELAKSTNLISDFPKEYNVYKTDVLGFDIYSFLNGTNNKIQVFPNPTIHKFPEEKRVHTFGFELDNQIAVELCRMTRSIKPLHFAHICKQKTTKTFLNQGASLVVYQRYNHQMLKLEEYVIELFSTKYAIRECNDIKLIDEFLILSC